MVFKNVLMESGRLVPLLMLVVVCKKVPKIYKYVAIAVKENVPA